MRSPDRVGDIGSDWLWGDPGNDVLIGGSGIDTYVLCPGDGTDTITEFVNGGDRLALADGLTFADLTLDIDSTNRVVIRVEDETLAILVDIPNGGAASIDEEDFLTL